MRTEVLRYARRASRLGRFCLLSLRDIRFAVSVNAALQLTSSSPLAHSHLLSHLSIDPKFDSLRVKYIRRIEVVH